VASARGLDPSQKLRVLVTTLFLGFVAAAWYYGVLILYRGRLSYPESTFLCDPGNRFHDFIDVSEYARSWDPYGHGEGGSYFPFSYLVMGPLFALKGFAPIFIYLAGFVAFLATRVARTLREATGHWTVVDVLTLTVLSYPVLFLIDRGNTDGLVFAFCFLAVQLRERRPRLAIFLLACATAMKLYPIVLLPLLIDFGRGRDLLRRGSAFVGTCLALSWAALLVCSPPVLESLRMFWVNLTRYNGIGLNIFPLRYNSSLYAPGRILLGFFHAGYFEGDVPALVAYGRVYQVFALIYALGVGAWAAFVERALWKRAFLLCSIFWISPVLSFDYRLVHVYIALLAFVADRERTRFDLAYALLFGLLLVPKSYWIVYPTVTSVSLFTAPLILAIVALIGWERLELAPLRGAART
jgi:uncharacterized membrane protein